MDSNHQSDLRSKSANDPKRKHSTCASSYLLLTLNEYCPGGVIIPVAASTTIVPVMCGCKGAKIRECPRRAGLAVAITTATSPASAPSARVPCHGHGAVWKVTLPSTFCIT